MMLRFWRNPIRRCNVLLRHVHVDQGEWNVWLTQHRYSLNVVMKEIAEKKVKEAQQVFIDETNWKAYVNKFRRDFHFDPHALLDNENDISSICKITERVTTSNIGDGKKGLTKSERDTLFRIISAKGVIELKDVVMVNKVLASAADMSIPHSWYPRARLMKRKIFYHGGPTNSGKTYQALQRLKNADPEKGGGLYCGPLRLLALEVYENLNKAGAFTNLLTGQEKREVPGATHISCTVEMVNLSRSYDVVVMDEIQMIGDKDRGYAWTRVLQGVEANEVHVCGGLEAAEVVESLCKSTGDAFELIKYERKTQLVVAEESLRGDYSKIRPGDCIVAFSKADLFCIKKVVQQMTKYKVGVVYGQLPPETRSAQARRYNQGYYDVLVASDAIGMGLNLNIRRIVFHNTLKSRGRRGVYWVDPSSVKQIAGRAGRMSSDYKVGEVTTWQEVDLAYVRAVMKWDIPQIKQVGIFPSVQLIEHFSSHLEKAIEMTKQAEEQDKKEKDREFGIRQSESSSSSSSGASENNSATSSSSDSSTDNKDVSALVPTKPAVPDVGHRAIDNLRLATVIERFAANAKTDERYFLSNSVSMIVISNWLHSIPLSIADSEITMYRLYEFAAMYAQNRPVVLPIKLNRRLPRSLEEFTDLCDKHNVIELYLWLSLRFPKLFIEQESCREMKTYAVKQIEQTLQSNALNEIYAYGKEYRKLRDRLKADEKDIYPPEEFGVVRETAMEYIDRIDEAVKYVEPPKEKDEEVDVKAGSYGGSFGYGNNSFRGAGEHGRSNTAYRANPYRINRVNTNQTRDKMIRPSPIADVLQAREDRQKKAEAEKTQTVDQNKVDKDLEKMVELLASTDD